MQSIASQTTTKAQVVNPQFIDNVTDAEVERQHYSFGEFINALRATNPNDPIHFRFLKPKDVPKGNFDWGNEEFGITSIEALPIDCLDDNFEDDLTLAVRKEALKQLVSSDRADELAQYFVVNGGGNKDKDIKTFYAVFCENDKLSIQEQHRQLDAFPLPTSAKIETAKSVHGYWFLNGATTKAEWEEIQKRLIAYFDADPSIKNPSRVMRRPDSDHTKVDGQLNVIRKPVRCVKLDESRRYYAYQMLQALPKVESSESDKLIAKVNQLLQAPKKLIEPGECHAFAKEKAAQLRALGYTGEIALEHLRLDYDAFCSHEPDENELESIIDWSDEKDESDSAQHIDKLIERAKTTSGLGKKGGFMLDNSTPLPPAIIPGVYPGYVNLLVSTNNIGKTKLMRNLALSLTTGRSFLNLTYDNDPIRVAYFDAEDATVHTQHDCAKMGEDFTKKERELVNDNLLYFIDEEIDDEPLDLSNDNHWEHVNKRLDMFRPRVIFIDTAVAAFKIENENDNAEIAALMKKLRVFARRHNAAVFLAHHTGTRGENGITQAVSIRARGASVFEDQARTVYTLDVIKPKMKGLIAVDKVVRLKGKKIKGEHIEDTFLDFDTTGQRRWFTEILDVDDETQTEDKTETRLELLFNMILGSEEGKVSKPEAMKHLGMSQKTFEKFVDEYVSNGAVIKEQAYDRAPVYYSLPVV